MTMVHEKQLFLSFIVKDKRERYLNLLNSQKGRIKLRKKLPHLNDLNPKYAYKIQSYEQNVSSIINMLKNHNAPKACYIIAEHSDYDQKNMTLEEAFSNLFASGIAYFISCIPGELAYFEGEEPNERYILYKIY